jgi:hypothetical protein
MERNNFVCNDGIYLWEGIVFSFDLFPSQAMCARFQTSGVRLDLSFSFRKQFQHEGVHFSVSKFTSASA